MAQAFGRYWLHEKIGHGGMAEIFRATIGPDPETYAFELVIKRLHAELEKDPKQVGTFLTEADVAKFLRHPNLVQVYEAGIIEGHVYIAMEYIWGFDLARLIDTLRRRRIILPPELAVYITLQLLRGLDYVHQAKNSRGEPLGVVHRDVTPSNIYVTFRGEVKLGDFGIARVENAIGAEEAGVLRGKVHYMPPEVIKGERVTSRVDLWSLAVTLYEMLTARPLREGVAESDMLEGRYDSKVEAVHRVNQAVPQELSTILARALQVNVKKRPADSATFYRELKQWLAQSTLVVDAAALARFVRAGTNVSGAEPKAQSGEAFANPDYLAPIEFSPTQRYEMAHRRPNYARPLMVGAPIALILAMGAGYWMAARHRGPVAMAVMDDATFDAELSGSSDSASRERFRTLMRQGAAQLKKKSFDAARGAFHQALEIQPSSAAAQLGLARTLYEQRDYTAAEKVASFLVQQQPANPRAHFLLGSILRASGEVPRARKAFEQCLQLDPKGEFGKSAAQILEGW